MDTEARQLALRNFEAAKRAETDAARLFNDAKRATEKTPGSRAAVLAQQAYKNRLNAEVGRHRAAFALLAANLGEQAEGARKLAATVKNAEKQRVLIAEAQHAERRRNLMMQAADAVTKSLENLPGMSANQTPPSAQQTTVGISTSFRSPEFLSRFTHFFPGDVRAAAGSIQNNGFAGLDAVGECEVCAQRDLEQVRMKCAELPHRVSGSSGDPMYSALVNKGVGFARHLAGLGSDNVSVGVVPPTVTAPSFFAKHKTHIILGAAAAGVGYYFFTRS